MSLHFFIQRSTFFILFFIFSKNLKAATTPPSADAQAMVNQVGATNCNTWADGFHCFIKVNSKLVSMIIPRNYVSSGNCLIHFHGLRMRSPEDATPRATIEYFKFEVPLNRQSPDTLMIAPIGGFGSNNYTLTSDYGTLTKLSAMLSGVQARTGELCNSITLSGHSAGYRVMTPLLNEANNAPSNATAKKFKKVFLFDALYSSNVAPFNTWMKNNSTRLIYNVSPSGSSTRNNSLKITSGAQYKNYVSTINDHWNLVRDKYFSLFIAGTR